MPKYSFIDDKTGKKHYVEFERPPTEEDWSVAIDHILGSKKTGLLQSVPAGVESLFATGSNIIGKMGFEATGVFHHYLANIQEALGQPSDVVQMSRNTAKEAWEIARYAGTQEELKRRKLAEKYPGNKFAREVGEAAASLAPTLATLPLGGAAGWGRTGQILLGAGTAGGTSAAMEHYEQRTLRFDRYKMTHGHLDQNDLEMMAVGEALVPALASGLLTAGITAGSGFAGTKLGLGGGVEALGVKAGGTGATSKVPWMMRGSRATATAKQAGGQALSEGIEEGFDEILQSYIVKRMTINPEITFSDAVDRGVDAFMVGAALGGSIGGIGTKRAKKEVETAVAARAELQKREHAQITEELKADDPGASDAAVEKKLAKKIRSTKVGTPTEIIRQKISELTTREQAAIKREEKGRIVKDIPERKLRDKALSNLEESLKTKKEVKTFNEMFGLSRERTAERGAAEVGIAPPADVTEEGAPMLATEPVSKKADLGKIFPGPRGTQITQGLTSREQTVIAKDEKGRLLSGKEVKVRNKAKKKLADRLNRIKEKRKKTKKGKQLDMLGMGTAYEVMVDIGLEAAIATVEVTSSVAKVMRSALDAMKMSNPKAFADVDVEDIKAYMAGRIADEMHAIDFATDEAIKVYHGGAVEFPERITSAQFGGLHSGTREAAIGRLTLPSNAGNKGAIHELEISPQKPYRILDERKGSDRTELWRISNDPNIANELIAQGYDTVPYINSKEDVGSMSYLILDPSIIKRTGGVETGRTSMGLSKSKREALTEWIPDDPKPFKASIKKLEKLQKKLRAFHRKGKLGANPIIEIAATAADVAVEVAIKTLTAGGTIKAAMDAAYASLGETDIKYSEFRKYIHLRTFVTMNELSKGNSMEAAIKASAEPMEGKTYEEIQRDSAKADLAKNKGVHPDIDKKDIKDFRTYSNVVLRNLAAGPAEAMAGSGAFLGIGARLNDHVDYADSFASTLSTMLLEEGNSDSDYNDSDSLWDKWMGKPSEEFKAAAAEFAVYYEAHYDGKLDEIDYDGMSERGKSLIEGWKNGAEWTGDKMVEEGTMVKYPNKKKRKFRKLGRDYFHHSMQRKYVRLLNSMDASSEMTQSIEDLGDILKEAGEIDTVSTEAIREWWINRTGGKPKKGKKKRGDPFIGYAQSDAFITSIDRARTKGKLPSKLMDFTLEGAQEYNNNWAERFAQIKAYGQKLSDPKGTDLFEKVGEHLEDLGYTKELKYLNKVRDAAYGISDKHLNSGQRMLMLLNKSATLTMLTGMFNSLKNMTGIGPSAATFGYARTFKALMEMRDYAAAAKKTRSWGVIRDNMALLLSGHDITMEGMGYLDQADKELTRATKWGLRASGFTQSENFVRTTTALTASSLVSEGVGAIKSGKNEGLQNELKELSRQMGIDWKKLVEEDSSQGAETLKFVRNAVKKVQGGYRFNQLPAYMATPIGRFMFKFGAYSQQIGNLVWHNGIKRATKGDLKPLMLLLAQAAGSGELLYGIRDAIFGKPRPDATLKELFQGDNKAYNLFMRLVNDVTYAGTLGIVADMAGMAKNVASKQRVRNPFDPAGLQIITNTLQFLLERVNEGTILKPWTWDEGLGYFIRRQFSIARYGKSGVMNLASKLGIEFDMVESERAFQNRNFLRNATERFQLSIGDDVKSRIGAGTTLPGPYTRFYRAVKDRLTLGDVNGAREAAEAFSKELDPKSRGRAWQRLSQSIMRSQPIKVGHSTSKEIQEEFITWAKRNLSQSDVNTIMKTQHTFLDTAKDAGLIGASSEKAKRDMKKRMNLKLPRDRRGGGAVRPMSTAEDYLRRENRRMKEAFGY